MREAFKIFVRFLPKYKGYLIFNVISNLLAALFGVFSIFTLIPILKVLFGIESGDYVFRELKLFPLNDFRTDAMNNLYAFISNLIIEKGASSALMVIGLFTIIMVLLKTSFTYSGSFCVAKIRNHVVKDIRNKLYRKVISLPIGYFNEKRKGDIIARMTGDVQEVEYSIGSPIDVFFKNPLIILFSLLAMVFMSMKLTLFVFILLPLSGGIIGYIGKSLRKKSMKGQIIMGEILSTIEETLGGLRIVKGFNAEDKMSVKQKSQNERYRRILDSVMSRNFLASPVSELLGTVVMIVVMWFGGKLIIGNKSALEPEEFIVYLGLFYTIINPAKGFSTAYYRIQKGLASLERIDNVLNTESNILVKKDTSHLESFNNSITYNNIWFKYQEDYVLKNINLEIKKGQTVALVGRSGSGKSTLVDLLPRFYDVTSGSIMVDGIDIRDLNPENLRKHMGLVNQEPILFNDTLSNNIAFGVEHATMEEIEYAAKIANAHDFILDTENGYDTIIGDRGSRLSGGQRQRISIARAILTNAPIMILDEATSSLDTESEKLVQEAINNLLKDRTSIVIAHRLSTIRHADMIYVLSDGEIIENGNYDELLKQNGEFRKLHNNQFE